MCNEIRMSYDQFDPRDSKHHDPQSNRWLLYISFCYHQVNFFYLFFLLSCSFSSFPEHQLIIVASIRCSRSPSLCPSSINKDWFQCSDIQLSLCSLLLPIWHAQITQDDTQKKPASNYSLYIEHILSSFLLPPPVLLFLVLSSFKVIIT